MMAIYHTDLNELTSEFLKKLKKQFKNAKVEIVIKDVDETEYLNSSKRNRQILNKAIKDVENSLFINKTLDELL